MLLAIVFVISNFIALGKIEIDLPQASSGAEITEVKHNIAINSNKEFFLNDKPYSKELLMVEIDRFKKDDIVTIISDKEAVYEDFIFVIDLLKQKDIDKISMAVKK